MPAARVSLSPEDFIRTRLALAPLPFRPDISLYRPTPGSGLNAWLAEQGRAGVPPYWAYAWAGGAALALYLRDHPELVSGRTVLDFGAGSGLAGIAAAKAGAGRVTALEPDPLGQAAARLNAEANGVELSIGTELPKTDIVLAGDVFYTAEVAARTLPVLSQAAERGATVLIGDPFRRDLPLDHLELLAEYRVPDMGSGAPVRAGIFALRP
ncbi:50S ribosomal protein L11 methyltransferase [Devosia sp. YIM 151766]|uniref:class I SAM-dependent methyltransferase n=1 Tax=Devosia sp. YIM 151766 TaxID=3017325 RepID=UPI00255CCB30|nr:50S ribosomal protein L11 methyltransferase [Devosia sp. YIM 151766]WIY52668.1 50S ribosomal protein L11 methyltransferase [Devosia sp. YIM 151766]